MKRVDLLYGGIQYSVSGQDLDELKDRLPRSLVRQLRLGLR